MRDIGTETKSFVRQARASLLAATGVELSAIHPSAMRLVPGFAISAAVSNRRDPTDFVRDLAAACGLATGAGLALRERNDAVLSLVIHAADDGGWALGGDGAIYRERDGGAARISPACDREAGGFDVALVDGVPIPGASARATLIGRGLGIEEAVALADGQGPALRAA